MEEHSDIPPREDPGERRSEPALRAGERTDRDRKIRKLTWGVTGALAGLAILLTLFAALRPPSPLKPPEEAVPGVAVVRIRARPHKETIELPARIKADRRAAVSSEFDGRLAEWKVAEGEKVRQGQVVAVIDDSFYRAKLKEAEAERDSARNAVVVARRQLEQAKIALEKARRDEAALSFDLEAAQSELDLSRREFKRLEELSKQEIVTASEIDAAQNRVTQAEVALKKVREAVEKAKLAVAAARARAAEAQASLELYQSKKEQAEAAVSYLLVSLEKTKLLAPVSGRLDKYFFQAGEAVEAGKPLALIYDLDHLRVQVDVPDRYMPFLELGNSAVQSYIDRTLPGAKRVLEASIVLPGLPKLTGGSYDGLEFPARVAWIAGAADPGSNTFKVELRLANPEGALREGMIARARITYLSYPRAITIPLRAVNVTDAGPRVLVVEERNGVEYAFVRAIEPVSIRGEEVLVASGLSDGERVIVSGGKGILDGERVKVLAVDGVFTNAEVSSAREK